MIVSQDLDCTNTLYIQFYFKFITKGYKQISVCSFCSKMMSILFFFFTHVVVLLFALWAFVGVPERSHSVLLQYSVNGGISWLMLDEFYFPASTDTLFLHLPLPASAQTNATRFRLWQPYNSGVWTLRLHAKIHIICAHYISCLFLFYIFFLPPPKKNQFVKFSLMFHPSGKKEEVWVIDDLIIDGSSLHNPPVAVDSFEEGPSESNWLFFPGGNTGLYCPYQKTGL